MLGASDEFPRLSKSAFCRPSEKTFVIVYPTVSVDAVGQGDRANQNLRWLQAARHACCNFFHSQQKYLRRRTRPSHTKQMHTRYATWRLHGVGCSNFKFIAAERWVFQFYDAKIRLKSKFH